MPQCVRIVAPHQLEIAERPPLKPGPQEVVIAVETAGVCGTDLALYSGDYAIPLPLVPGHEFIGRVTSVGDGVDASWLSRRVTAEINNTCLAYSKPIACTACQTGLANHCLERTVTGIIRHDGAFAEELVVPAGALHLIPESIDPHVGPLVEPLAAALQTFEMTPVEKGDTVVVLGPGRLGILIVFAASLRGLKVIAVSRSPEKRKRAHQFGADKVYAPEEAEEHIKGLTKGLGANLVVDATGSPDGLTQAFQYVRPRGTVSVKTTCGLPAQGIDMTGFVVNEIRLQGSRCGPFSPALEILQAHQDQLKHLVTCVQPLSEADKAIPLARQEDKVIFEIGVSK